MKGIVLGRFFGFGQGGSACCGGAGAAKVPEVGEGAGSEPCCGSGKDARREGGAESCCAVELRLEPCCAAGKEGGGGSGAAEGSPTGAEAGGEGPNRGERS